jgi:uncharacterized protein YjiS (DUF1127 family)
MTAQSMGLHSTGRLKMQTSLFKKMLEPSYYTASVDSNSMAGQVSHQVVKSSSLRQVMRAASRFNAAQPPEALIQRLSAHERGRPEACRQALSRRPLLEVCGEVPVILHTLFRRHRAWKRRVAERRELMQLTDRELADIGISRSEIDRVVSQDIAELR